MAIEWEEAVNEIVKRQGFCQGLKNRRIKIAVKICYPY
jgi:hypothetical protein